MVVALILATLATTDASAQPTPPRVVFYVAKWAPQRLADILPAVRAELQGLPVHLELARTATWPRRLAGQVRGARQLTSREGVLAVFWLTINRRGHTLVHLIEPGTNQILVRTIDESSTAVRASLVGTILRTTLQAMLAGASLDRLVELPAPTMETMVSSAASDSRRPGWMVEVAVTSNVVSDSPLAAHALALSARLDIDEWSLVATYRVAWPLELSGKEMSLRVDRHPVALGARRQWRFGAFCLGPAVEVALDYTTTRATSSDPGVAARSPKSLVVSVSSLLHLEYGLTDNVGLTVGLGVEVPLNPVQYAVARSTGQETLFVPWPVHPRGQVGMLVRIP